MSAMFSASNQSALFAGKDRAKRMPSSMPAMCMEPATSIRSIGTDVLTSVSLVADVLIPLLLTLLGVLIRLSGLTGGVLVGLIRRLDTSIS